MARETGLLKLGTVSIKPAPAKAGGTKIDANASKIRSVRYDRARALREKPAADLAELTAQAEAADAEDTDPQALPAEIARRAALKDKLDAAGARLAAEAKAEAAAARPPAIRGEQGGLGGQESPARPAAQTARRDAAAVAAEQSDRPRFAADAQVESP